MIQKLLAHALRQTGKGLVVGVRAQRALSLGVRGIGFDSMSPDPVSDRNYTNHKLILGEGALIIENLCGLAPIRGRKTKFTALPLKYLNADGAPCRAVAVED